MTDTHAHTAPIHVQGYRALTQASAYCYEEKRSRFLAFVHPVTDKEQGFEHLATLKQQYPDARHHCWAYRIGHPDHPSAAGFGDAGEPAGTAGKPMLNVLTQRGVGDVFAVVVRYFGGIKLGAGRLTRAYGQAVSGALDCATWHSVIPKQTLAITCDFSAEQRVRNTLGQHDATQVSATYGQGVTLLCQCPTTALQALQQTLREQTAGNIDIRHIP